MLRRRVDGIQLNRRPPGIVKVMPRSGRNKYYIVVINPFSEIQIVFVFPHHHNPLPLLNSQELVKVVVDFKPDILPGLMLTMGKLQMVAGPQRRAEIAVIQRRPLNIGYKRIWPVVGRAASKTHIVKSCPSRHTGFHNLCNLSSHSSLSKFCQYIIWEGDYICVCPPAARQSYTEKSAILPPQLAEKQAYSRR